MTAEGTDRFNGIPLSGMVLFWQKAVEYFTKFIIHFLTYKVEHLFNSDFYCLLVFLISFRLAEIWILGSQIDAQPTDQCPRIDGCLTEYSSDVRGHAKLTGYTGLVQMEYGARTFSTHINNGGGTFFRKHIYGANTSFVHFYALFFTLDTICAEGRSIII